jgi:hypothetical protein
MCRSRGECRRPAIRRWPTSAGPTASTRNIQIFPHIICSDDAKSRFVARRTFRQAGAITQKNQARLKEKSRSPSGLSLYQRISRAGNRKIFDRAGRCASPTIIGVSFRFESFVVFSQSIVVYVQVMAAESSQLSPQPDARMHRTPISKITENSD